MVAPLLIGLAAGALGFVLGGINKPQPQPEKKEEPAPPPPPDPRIDQIMQSQQRQEALLNQLLGRSQAASEQQGQQPQQPYGMLHNPAALNAYLGGACTPGQFSNLLDHLLSRMPPPSGRAEMFFLAGARCS